MPSAAIFVVMLLPAALTAPSNTSNDVASAFRHMGQPEVYATLSLGLIGGGLPTAKLVDGHWQVFGIHPPHFLLDPAGPGLEASLTF